MPRFFGIPSQIKLLVCCTQRGGSVIGNYEPLTARNTSEVARELISCLNGKLFVRKAQILPDLHCVWTPKGDHASDQHSVILVDCAPPLGLGQYLSTLFCTGRRYWWIIAWGFLQEDLVV